MGVFVSVYQAFDAIRGTDNIALATSAAVWGALAGGSLVSGLIYITIIKKLKRG